MPQFFDHFESGTLANWPTQTGNVAASQSAAGPGSSWGARLTPGGGVAGQIATSTTKWSQSTYTWARIRTRFRLNSLPVGTTADLVTLQATTQLDNLDFFYNHTTGTFHFDLKGASAFIDTGVVPVLGHWYELQVRVFYGATTYIAQVMLDGVIFNTLLSPGETSSFVRSLHLGTSSTSKTYSLDVDDIDVQVSTSEPPFDGINSMALTSRLVLELSGTLTSSLDFSTPMSSVDLRSQVDLSSGTGAGQADKLWADQRTLSASATEDLDLVGVLTDAFGATISLARVKAILIRAAAANTNNVVVGGASATQWAALLGTTGTVTLRPGAAFLVAAGAADATGYVCAAGATDLLKIANSGAGTSVTYDIAVIGASA